jgi:hypothetical protein
MAAHDAVHRVAAPDVARDVPAQGAPHAVSAARPHDDADVVGHATVAHVAAHAVPAGIHPIMAQPPRDAAHARQEQACIKDLYVASDDAYLTAHGGEDDQDGY